MHENSLHRRGQRGSVMLLYVMIAGFLLLLVGMAIDVTMLYIAQGQLQTAVDGAASGAARLSGSNANLPEIAKEFVKANLPNGYWWTNNLTITNASITPSATKNVANVSATVDVPLIFLRFLGRSTSTVGASGKGVVWNVQPCTLTYPYGSAPALSSVVFNEAIDLVGWGPTYVLPHGKIIAWYNDEHALTLGVRKVYVKSSSGAVTVTDYTNQFTAYTGHLSAGSDSAPLPVGTTALSGDQAGTDTAAWTATYNYQSGRPIWPALFITDITTNSSDTSGDWQEGGNTAVPPNIIYGTWKGTIRCVDYTGGTTCPATAGGAKTVAHPAITFAEDADPSKNNWNGLPDTPPGGFPSSDGYGAEIVWDIDSLNLRPGHNYRLQLMLHDGDQHQSGGDVGEGCMVAKY